MQLAKRLAIAAVFVAAPAAANAGTLTTLYAFTGGTNGGDPTGPLIYQHGALYGTTPAYDDGNLSFLGNVFKVNAATGAFEVVYAFQGAPDGASPLNGVIYEDGILFGTTLSGGAAPCGCGTIFSIDPKSHAETVLYSFGNGGDLSPARASALVYQAGAFYGTTAGQGGSDDGSVFSFNPTTGAFTTLYSFAGGKDGASPNSRLLYQNGLFYGTTVAGGGRCNCGTVFAINSATGTETLLHAFSTFAGGEYPVSNLIYYAGSLQGDTGRGGISPPCKYGCGVSFAINAESGAETILDTFSNRKATYAALTLKGEAVYETLGEGGGHGKLIKADLKSGKQTTMYRFTGGTDGDNPEAPLIYHDGAFYGSTTSGGAHGYGIIFKYVP